MTSLGFNTMAKPDMYSRDFMIFFEHAYKLIMNKNYVIFYINI